MAIISTKINNNDKETNKPRSSVLKPDFDLSGSEVELFRKGQLLLLHIYKMKGEKMENQPTKLKILPQKTQKEREKGRSI